MKNYLQSSLISLLFLGIPVLANAQNFDPPAVRPPTGLSGHIGIKNMYLQWNPNLESGIAGYIVYRANENRIFHAVNDAPVKTTSFIVFQSKSYTIYSDSVVDAAYGAPPAYVPNRETIISPTRVEETFTMIAGGKTVVVDREDEWHPKPEINKFPALLTGHNTVDGAYNVALDLFYRCTSPEFASPDHVGMWCAGYFQGKGHGYGIWVRDACHNALRMGNLLDPQGARRSLVYVSSQGTNNGNDGSALPAIAIWDYVLATGDESIIGETWGNLKKKVSEIDSRFDPKRNLVTADFSTFLDGGNEKPLTDGFPLSTNILYMEAYRTMALMGKRVGEPKANTERWAERSEIMRRSIRENYWKPSAGFFTLGPKGSLGYNENYWENGAQEAAVWPRFGIATPEQRRSILQKAPEIALNEYGFSLGPYRKGSGLFSNVIWPVTHTGLMVAAAREENFDMLMQVIAAMVREAVMNKTYYECIRWREGTAWRFPGQLWHALGTVSIFYLGVLGIEYDEMGLTFEHPAVPESLKNMRVTGFKYRTAELDILVEGWGTRRSLLLDGKKVDRIPTDLKGKHTLTLVMSNGARSMRR